MLYDVAPLPERPRPKGEPWMAKHYDAAARRPRNLLRQEYDRWRMTYDEMPFAEHQAFQDRLLSWLPEINREQRQYRLDMVERFFKAAPIPARVFELGGWTGALALNMLTRHAGIERWDNYDLCRAALEDNVCLRAEKVAERYRHVHMADWVWHLTLAEDYNVAVFSHILEHMTWADIERVFAVLPTVKALYIDAPIEMTTEKVNWDNYYGTHILEIGWDDLETKLSRLGFTVVGFSDDRQVRMFQRN